jgi:hypothetical protein
MGLQIQLEAKLGSIPWLDGNSVVPDVAVPASAVPEVSGDAAPAPAPSAGGPEYEKFFKMLKLGLPVDVRRQ